MSILNHELDDPFHCCRYPFAHNSQNHYIHQSASYQSISPDGKANDEKGGTKALNTIKEKESRKYSTPQPVHMQILQYDCISHHARCSFGSLLSAASTSL